jgi:hypothetical protein
MTTSLGASPSRARRRSASPGGTLLGTFEGMGMHVGAGEPGASLFSCLFHAVVETSTRSALLTTSAAIMCVTTPITLLRQGPSMAIGAATSWNMTQTGRLRAASHEANGTFMPRIP